MESTFARIIENKFINRGFLTGTFCPIYGFGAILIIISSEWINSVFENYFVAIIVALFFSTILVTVLEYITGFALEKILNFKWWDYGDKIANLHGYICLEYSLLWGLLALILIQIVHPAISEFVFSIPVSARFYIAVFMLLYFMADTVKSVFDALDLKKAILNTSNSSVNKYYEKTIRYKRFFLAFPHLLIINAGIINRDVRNILDNKIDKIKIHLRSMFL